MKPLACVLWNVMFIKAMGHPMGKCVEHIFTVLGLALTESYCCRAKDRW